MQQKEEKNAGRIRMIFGTDLSLNGKGKMKYITFGTLKDKTTRLTIKEELTGQLPWHIKSLKKWSKMGLQMPRPYLLLL